MKKIQLVNALQRFADYAKPRLELEQYSLDAVSAADVIYVAGFEHDDLVDKDVLDVGCGVGRLAGGALLFGASRVVGLDVDLDALRTARANLASLGNDLFARAGLVQGDVATAAGLLRTPGDWTVLANPPFGVHSRGADTKFVAPLLKLANKIYVLHLGTEKVREFLARFYEDAGFHVDLVYEIDVVLPRTYRFHSKRRKRVRTNLFCLTRAMK
ncbi:MAG: METTL5 family protein [Promethearchaeota archaeon]